MKTRKEFDSIGTINVPNEKYWGASTQRSKKYFDIGEFLVRPVLISSIAIIKKSAAIVHKKKKQIDTKIANAIIKASDEIIKGKLNKFIKENTLLGQPLITDPKKSVSTFLDEVARNNNIDLNITSMDLYTI